MAYTDLSEADHDLLLRLAKEGAVKALGAADRAMLLYLDYLRQDAERRLGVPAGDMRALEDPPYDQMLDAYNTLVLARGQVEADSKKRGAP